MAAFKKSSSGRGKGPPRGKKAAGGVKFRKRSGKSDDKPAFSERKKSTGSGRGYGASLSDRKPYRSSNSTGSRPEREIRSDNRPFRERKTEDRPFNSGPGKSGYVKSGEKKFERSQDRPFRPRKENDRPFSGGVRKEGFNKTGDRKFERSADRPFRARKDNDRPFSKGERKEGFDKRGDKKFERSADRPFRARKDDRSFSSGEHKEGFEKTGEKKFERSGDRPLRPRKRSGEERPYTKPEGDSTERKPFDRPVADRDRPYSPRRNDDRGSTSRPPVRGWGKERSAGSEEDSDRKWNRKESHEFYGDKRKSKPFGKKSAGPKTTAADDGLTRLNKFISNAGICSRREADEMIGAGVITVNGEVITEMGYKVKPGDIVKYNNAILRGEKLVYLLLNKPKDFITTTDDPEERKTVMNLIASACKERVYPVGRLDRNTTGVILMTNDGDLARKLTHPSFEVQKVYQVELDSSLNSNDFQKIAEGLKLDDGFIKVDDIAYVGAGNDKSIIGVEVHSGRNRIVRRIFEHLGYRVKKLDRVIFAGLTKKDVPRGRYRFLSPMEVANLKMMTGDKKFTSAGS